MDNTKIIQWNCRGIKTNFNELKVLTQTHNPSIIALQETHLKETDNLSLKNYHMYNTFSPDGPEERAKGGSSLLIKQGIIHSHIPLNTDLQAVAARITLDKTVTICSLYIPPASRLQRIDLDNLVDQLPAPFILLGDFNGHNPLWGGDDYNTKGRLLETFIAEQALCFLNDGSYTYLHPGTGTYSAIDLTLTDPAIMTDFSWAVWDDLCGSDHFPIIIEHDKFPNEERVPKWNFNKADWTSFSSQCQEQLTNLSYNNEMHPIDTFTNALISIADNTIPKTSTSPAKPHLPWDDQECKDARKDRKKAERKFNRQPTTQNLENVRIARAKARRITNHKRRDSWKNYVSKLTTRTPLCKVWNMVKKMKGKNAKAGVQHLKKDNEVLTAKEDIAEELAKTFEKNSSTQNYSEEFQRKKEQKEGQRLNFKSNNLEDYNQPFTLDELLTALKKSHDTATGPDQVHYQLLKHLPNECLTTLLNLFNDIWESGNIPPSWKNATVIPVPKPGKDHTNALNYRPIALTSCMCKTMERMVNDRLVWLLESNGLITDFQCGFRKNRSTTDHLVRLESFVRDAFVKKEHVVAVFFDLEKAYDTTWKYGIMKDLHDMGFRGKLPLFLLNFLIDREFNVRVGSTLSESHEQEMGVPQGSILSVTLFSIKINSIVKTVHRGVSPSLYVDDFLICYRAKRMENIERQLQLSLNKLHDWSNENGFKFSKAKTVCMHFCRLRKLHHDPELFLGEDKIKVVTETRFLGLIFDSKLNFLPHIKALKLRCLKALNVIKAVANTDWGADCSVLLQLYRSLVRSKLDYGSIVYGSAPKSYLKQLNTVHHQGLRLCLGAFRTSPVESLYVAANEPSLENRRIKLSLQYVVKLAANPSNPAHNCVFRPNYHQLYEAKRKAIKPLGIRIQPHLLASQIDIENIAPIVISEMPPWEIHRPQVFLHLTKHKKADTDASVFRNDFFEFKSRYPNYSCFYTDGSKDKDRVASAAICKQKELSERLPGEASIYTAEVRAILLALKEIERSNRKNFIIFSDSLSTLQALSNCDLGHPYILEVLNKLTQLHLNHFDIIFCWVPSHVGLAGNERADSAAKEALNLPLRPCGIPHTDFKPSICTYTKHTWQESWATQTSNKLHSTQPVLGLWQPYGELPRRDQVVLTRCRIGHSRITHSFLLKDEPLPKCIPCDSQISVHHLIMECGEYAHIRQQYFVEPTLERVLNIEYQNVLVFLKAAGLYHHF